MKFKVFCVWLLLVNFMFVKFIHNIIIVEHSHYCFNIPLCHCTIIYLYNLLLRAIWEGSCLEIIVTVLLWIHLFMSDTHTHTDTYINTHIYISVEIELLGLGIFICSALTYCQTVFQNAYIRESPHHRYMKVLVFYLLSNILFLLSLLLDIFQWDCESIVDLFCIYLLVNKIEHYFLCLLPFGYSL